MEDNIKATGIITKMDLSKDISECDTISNIIFTITLDDPNIFKRETICIALPIDIDTLAFYENDIVEVTKTSNGYIFDTLIKEKTK